MYMYMYMYMYICKCKCICIGIGIGVGLGIGIGIGTGIGIGICICMCICICICIRTHVDVYADVKWISSRLGASPFYKAPNISPIPPLYAEQQYMSMLALLWAAAGLLQGVWRAGGPLRRALAYSDPSSGAFTTASKHTPENDSSYQTVEWTGMRIQGSGLSPRD